MGKWPKWNDEFLQDKNLPVWAKPQNIRTTKRHCFVSSVSLCGMYRKYNNQSIIKSGVVYDLPQTICKKCRAKWEKEYGI